ncbi:MAG: hypothetical protein ACPG5W_00330 [Flavobacteriales bacterium]
MKKLGKRLIRLREGWERYPTLLGVDLADDPTRFCVGFVRLRGARPKNVYRNSDFLNEEIGNGFEFEFLGFCASSKWYVCIFNFRMENLDTYISGLSQRVEKLVAAQSDLKNENSELRSRNAELEQAVNDQKNVLSKLEEENKVVKIAKAVTDDDEDRKEQRKRLNELVREVDKCIALLNN